MKKESEPHDYSRLCEEVSSLRQKVDLFTAELDRRRGGTHLCGCGFAFEYLDFQSSLSRLNDLIEQEIGDMM